TSAAMWTQYYAAFIPLFHFIFLLATTRRPRAFLFPFISFISLFFLYLPWLLYAVPKLVSYVGDKVGIEQYAALPLWEYALRHLVAFSVGHLSADVAWLGWAAVVFVALAVWGVRQGAGSRGQGTNDTFHVSHATFFLLCYLSIPFLAAFLVQLRWPFAPPRMERLLLLASPAFLVLAANGLAQLNFKFQISNRSPRDRRGFKLKKLGVLGVFTVLLLAEIISLASFYTLPRYPEQDYRALANRINALALPSDVVMCVHPWQVGFLRAYLTVPVSVQMVASPAWGDADKAQLDAALDANRRVWLPAYQTLGRILETEMEKYLALNALPVEAQWYETTRLSFYASAPSFTPTFIPILANRWYVADQPHYAAGWGIVAIRLDWHSTNFRDPNLRVSIRLRDTRGQLWGMQDRAFVPHDANAPINSFIFFDRFGLLIAAGTPPGAYRVSAAVYDGADSNSIAPEAELTTIQVTRPTSPPPISALPIQTPFIADWVDVRLLGYTLRDGAWRAGDALHLDLFWQAQETANGSGRVFAHVQDAQGKVVASNAEQPAYPLSQWQRGDLIREQRDLTLPATLAPGTYRVVVGLARGSDQVTLREITVQARPHQITPPTPQVNDDVRFASAAKIVGHDLTVDTQQKTVTLRLHWQALREMDTAYKVFVHIIPPNGGAPIAQHDSPPANGALPTTSWVAGEYIADEHTITLPADAPNGTYRVLVGLYDPQSGARVPAFDASGRAFANDAAELETVHVK
ncbi:MAG: hypothetical protein ABI874_01670, partial [Chloroflexota bacterium]